MTSWRMFLDEGLQLPWYRVLSLTSQPGNPWLGTWWVPAALLAITAAVPPESGDMARGWRPIMPADTTGRELVSLVVPVFNESEVIGVFYARARAALASLPGFDYEILFIDDGSRDDSFAQLAAFAAGIRASACSSSRATSATRSRSAPASTTRAATAWS